MPRAVVVRPGAHARAARSGRDARCLRRGAEGLRGVRVRGGERRAVLVRAAGLLVAALDPEVRGLGAPVRVRPQAVELVQPDCAIDVVGRGLVCEQRRWPLVRLVPREI